MKNPKGELIGALIIFGLALAAALIVMVTAGSRAAGSLGNALQQAQQPETEQITVKPAKSEQLAKKQSAERPQEPRKSVETYQQPSETPAQPQATGSTESAPQKAPAAHIPFTNKDVTAGDPESYVDTVGQCPFYEMAGPKGCTPPPDIECNADWSECHLKGETE